MNPRQRQEEKRRVQLADMEDRVADGSLTIRPMNAAERRRFGIGDPDRPYRRFFFPRVRAGTRRAEQEYQRTARAVRAEVSVQATERRIFRVDCLLEDEPCRLQVGEPLADGEVVIAIFELRDSGELVAATADDPAALRVPAAGADVLDFA
jgi:hypothetical protein